MNTKLDDIVVWATIASALVPLIAIAVNGWRYVSYRKDELRFRRYEQYHQLLSMIGKGSDEQGPLKLVSQRAYLYELRHFPEYRPLTIRLLASLEKDWRVNGDLKDGLIYEMQETERFLNSSNVIRFKRASKNTDCFLC